MRCGCPECGVYMVHSEGEALGCACPECGYRCALCLGARGRAMSREEVLALKRQAGADEGQAPGAE